MTRKTPTLSRRSVIGLLAASVAVPGAASRAQAAASGGDEFGDVQTVRLERIGHYSTGEALGGAEIVSYDAANERLFVVNSGAGQVEVLDLSDPSTPASSAVLDASTAVAETDTGLPNVSGTNSVAVHDGIVAAAIEADPSTADGAIAFYDATSLDLLRVVGVGPLPDKVGFSPNGRYVVVANEGEPGESTDPAGSISVVDLQGGIENASVSTATFRRFDGQEAALREEGVHLVAPGDGDATASHVIEPEFVTFDGDSSTAYASLQENNAIATVDLGEARVTGIHGLGFKDFSLLGNEIDASDTDGISLQGWPVKGMYQPDAIDAYEVGGETFIVSANEGDAKDFEVDVLKNLELDPSGFTLSENPYVDSVEALKRPENIGNMEVNVAAMNEFADPNDDDAFTDIYALGGRSFSVWQPGSDGLDLVFDSGNDFERHFAEQLPAAHKNVTESGPETESIELGRVGNRTFAFTGQEVGSAIFVYDVTTPGDPEYVQFVENRNYDVSEDDLAAAAEENPESDEPSRAGDFAPEGVHFVSAAASPVENPLLCVGYELSGTVAVFEILPVTN